MRVKICGITRVEDALFVGNLGAWAVGFIFVPSSPRVLTLEKAREISLALENSYPNLLKIGVFADQPEEFIYNAINFCKLDGIQLHGRESLEFLERFDCKVKIKAFIVDEEIEVSIKNFIEEIRLYKDCIPLLDIPKDKSLTQDLLIDYASMLKDYGIDFIIAGGINLSNITRFLSLKPYAIDIARGVEIRPGIKDEEKLLEIFKLLKGDEISV
ncbi:MAG: phosphoribosylanthranilate isomerase [bacterium]